MHAYIAHRTHDSQHPLDTHQDTCIRAMHDVYFGVFFRTRDHSHAFFFRRSTDAPGSILENGNPSIIVHFLDSNLYEQGQSTLLSHELRFCSSTLSELTIATALSGRLEALRRGKNKKKMNALRENCKSALLVTSLISSIHFLEGCHFNGFRRASYRGGMRYHYIA